MSYHLNVTMALNMLEAFRLLVLVVTLTILNSLYNASVVHSAIPESNFLPFDLLSGNSRFRFGDDNAKEVAFVNSNFKFFNKTYWGTYISGNGLIAFGRGNTAASPGDGCPVSEFQMIMAFWADANEGVDPEGSFLTYMETTNTAYLNKVTQEIQLAFPHHRRRQTTISWIFIVTWKNIGSHQSMQTPSLRYNRNTFQLVLATDGVNSFVLFFYNKLTWSNGGKAAAGFDYGEPRIRYNLPGSCTTSIEDLSNRSNVNTPGKWIFQVDTDIIVPSDSPSRFPSLCQQSKSVLQIDPPVISIMGNVPLSIHGLCLEENADVSCVFHDKGRFRPVKVAAVLFTDVLVCPIPFMYSLGSVTLNLLVKYYADQSPTIHTLNIFVVKEHEFSDLPLIHVNKSKDLHFLSATWNPSQLSMTEIRKADISNSSASNTEIVDEQCKMLHETVEIILLEYDGKNWMNQGSITPPILNNGIHMSPLNTSLLNTLLPRKEKILLRTLAIEAKYKTKNGQIINKIIPSNSLIGTDNLIYLTVNHDSEASETAFFDQACDNWFSNEPHIHLDTLHCPNTVEQARVDWQFSLDESPHTHLLNELASAVYMQSIPSPSGTAIQCAYDNEGRLLQWMPSCGRLFRRSPNSVTGYWKHYLDDILPYMYCCKWGSRTGWDKCNQFFIKRPMDFGTDYVSPRPFRIVGDPHLTTFDGLSYTFNGAGEYWLVKYSENNINHVFSEFKMQVRMEPLVPLDGGPTNASVVTAAVMEEIRNEYEVKVQVVINAVNKGITIFVDDKPLDVYSNKLGGSLSKNNSPWNFQNEFTFHHVGVMIVLKSAKEALISFASGFAFNIIASSDSLALNIVGIAGASVKNRVKGLLGNYDGLMHNDFKLPNDTILEANLTMHDIHDNFGMQWFVNETETIFSYSSEKSYSFFHKPSFCPWLLSSEELYDMTLPEDEDFCFGFEDCIFDYLATGNIGIAEGTKGSSNLFKEIDMISKKVVKQCDQPTPPVNGYFNGTSSVVGSSIKLICSYADDVNLTQYVYRCAYQNGNENDKPMWTDAAGVAYTSLSCNEKDGNSESQETATNKMKYEMYPTAAVVTKASSSNGLWIIVICIFIFIIITVVVIAEYPPCKSVKHYFTDKYHRHIARRTADQSIILS